MSNASKETIHLRVGIEMPHDALPYQHNFASDNCAGAHPDVLRALVAANGGHQDSYGDDNYTHKLQGIVKSHFGDLAEAFPVFNGTGSNVIALQSMQPSWGAVICSDCAHLYTAEGAAPERVGALKLLPVTNMQGKITPAQIRQMGHALGIVHHAQPTAVTITQCTELGTVYTPEQIAAISDAAHSLGMSVHMDGARLSNAAASLNLPLRALTTDVDIDVVSFGGTKNGLVFGEAVIVLDPTRSRGLEYIRKFDMQLASKMRYISAQLIALLEGDLWLELATHANEMARLLRRQIDQLDGVTITQPTQANSIFATIADPVREYLHQHARFQDWDPVTGEVRWMCAFDTKPDEVNAFASLIAHALTREVVQV